MPTAVGAPYPVATPGSSQAKGWPGILILGEKVSKLDIMNDDLVLTARW